MTNIDLDISSIEAPTLVSGDAKLDDRVIIVHAMMLVCYIDGKMSSQELATIESYAKTLPDFHGQQFEEHYQAAKALAISAGGNIDLALRYLSRLQTDAVRMRTYYCLTELALSDGMVEVEDDLLRRIGDILAIEPVLAETIRRTIEIKFNSS